MGKSSTDLWKNYHQGQELLYKKGEQQIYRRKGDGLIGENRALIFWDSFAHHKIFRGGILPLLKGGDSGYDGDC